MHWVAEVPQAVVRLPAWQVPVESQHPDGHVAVLQACFAGPQALKLVSTAEIDAASTKARMGLMRHALTLFSGAAIN